MNKRFPKAPPLTGANGSALGRRQLFAGASVMMLARPAAAQRADARMNERAIGDPDAKLTVQEWFSLTCTHCAGFSGSVFPEVQAKLIETGRIRYVFRDFPLDRLALAAAALARALPVERYVPFIEDLFATQDQWAFARSGDLDVALGRRAALAGMSSAEFAAAVADRRLQEQILSEQADGQQRYGIEGTPTFIFGTAKIGPIGSYDAFAAAVGRGLEAG